MPDQTRIPVKQMVSGVLWAVGVSLIVLLVAGGEELLGVELAKWLMWTCFAFIAGTFVFLAWRSNRLGRRGYRPADGWRRYVVAAQGGWITFVLFMAVLGAVKVLFLDENTDQPTLLIAGTAQMVISIGLGGYVLVALWRI